MPSLTQFFKCKNSVFIFSNVFENTVPVRYGKDMQWKLIRNRSAKYLLLWQTTTPPLLIKVTGIISFLRKYMWSYSANLAWGALDIWSFLLGAPRPTLNVRMEGRVLAYPQYFLWPCSKLTEPVTPGLCHYGGAASVREAFMSAALSAPTPAACRQFSLKVSQCSTCFLEFLFHFSSSFLSLHSSLPPSGRVNNCFSVLGWILWGHYRGWGIYIFDWQLEKLEFLRLRSELHTSLMQGATQSLADRCFWECFLGCCF